MSQPPPSLSMPSSSRFSPEAHIATVVRTSTARWFAWVLAIVGACFACVVVSPASAAEAATSSEPGVVTQVEGAVTRGAHAAASGVERGARAAASGVERGAKATAQVARKGVSAAASGVARGARATGNAADHVARKVAPSASAAD